MSRPVASLLFAAAVSSVAAMSVVSIPEMSALADDTPQEVLATQTPTPAPAPLVLPSPTTTVLDRQVAVPQRDLDILAAPMPDPEPVESLDAPSRARRGTAGLLAAVGTSRDPVDAGGRTVRFSVEVEDGTGLDPDDVAALVEEALYDQRSWARTHDLHRVAPSEASMHVVIATPSAVDAICAEAGLRTVGWLSCWSGSTAAINLDRWEAGVDHIDDLDLYRRYVVAHEVGHGLGHGHRGCPGAGRLAPLMQQQTKSLQGCVANEWAFPDA